MSLLSSSFDLSAMPSAFLSSNANCVIGQTLPPFCPATTPDLLPRISKSKGSWRKGHRYRFSPRTRIPNLKHIFQKQILSQDIREVPLKVSKLLSSVFTKLVISFPETAKVNSRVQLDELNRCPRHKSRPPSTSAAPRLFLSIDYTIALDVINLSVSFSSLGSLSL